MGHGPPIICMVTSAVMCCFVNCNVLFWLHQLQCVVLSIEGLRSIPTNVEFAPPNMRILLKCVLGAAENLRISKFRAYTGRVCIFVWFVQFPAHDFGLDHFASWPFNCNVLFWLRQLQCTIIKLLFLPCVQHLYQFCLYCCIKLPHLLGRVVTLTSSIFPPHWLLWHSRLASNRGVHCKN